MKFNLGIKFSHNHGKNNSQTTPPPNLLLQQQRELLEAKAKVEREYEQQLKMLKGKAQLLVDWTRNNLNDVMKRDTISIADSQAAIKKNEDDFKKHAQKISEIKSILEHIAKGDISKIYELYESELYNLSFQNFDLKLYAAYSGAPDVVKFLLSDELKKVMEQKRHACLAKKSQQMMELQKKNLNPKFQPQLERPFLERAVGVFAFYQAMMNKPQGTEEACLSLQALKQHWGVSKETGHYNHPDTSGNFYSPSDNISRLIQITINQYFANRLPDPKKDINELIKVFSISTITAIYLSRIQNYFVPPLPGECSDNATKFKNECNFEHLYEKFSTDAKALVVAGMARVLCEKGNYGEDVGKMLYDAHNIYYRPIEAHINKLLILAHTPLELRKSLGFQWSLNIPALPDPLWEEWLNRVLSYPEWSYFVASYSEITQTGLYPLGDPRILMEAKAAEEKRLVSVLLNEQRYLVPDKIRKITVIIFNLMMRRQHEITKLKQNDSAVYSDALNTILENECKRLCENINLEEELTFCETDRLSKVVQNIIISIKNEEEDIEENLPLFQKSMGLSKIAIQHILSSECSKKEDSEKVLPVLAAGLARVMYHGSRFSSILCSEIWDLYKSVEIKVIDALKYLENRMELSKLSYVERRNESNIIKYNLGEADLEFIDLLGAYRKVCQISEYSIGDARLLLEAKKLSEQISEIEKYQKPILVPSSPFIEPLPIITECWRLHQFRFKDTEEWNLRIITPQELVLETQQGQSILHQHRKHLSTLVSSKMQMGITDTLRLLNDTTDQQSSRPVSMYHGLEVQNTEKFRFHKEGLYLLECRPKNFNTKKELYTHAVYVRNATFIKSSLLEFYECGKHTIEFQGSVSGEFTLQLGAAMQSQTLSNATQIEFNLEKTGPFSFKVCDISGASVCHKASAYRKSSIDWNRTMFKEKKTEIGSNFFLNDEIIAFLGNCRRLKIAEKPIASCSNELINVAFQRTYQALILKFRGEQEQKTAKIMMTVQRLLPESLMFSPFISMAGYFDDIDNPKGIDELVDLLCRQVALHEIMKAHGVDKTTQYISENSGQYPEHWANIFNLMHSKSEKKILQGLFLQTLQLHNQFLKASDLRVTSSELFKLTRQLFAFRDPEQVKVLNESLDRYLQLEPNYQEWLSEINSVLGADQKSLRSMERQFEDFLQTNTEAHYHEQIKLGEILGACRKQNFGEAVGIESECIQGIEQLKSNFEELNTNYIRVKKEIQENLTEIDRAITDYNIQYREEMRKAIRKARRKQRVCLIRNLVGMVVGAFLAPMIAPALLGTTSGLGLTIAEGMIGGAIKAGIAGGNVFKQAAIGGILSGFGLQCPELLAKLNMSEFATVAAAIGSKTLLSTGLNGGKVIPNLVSGFGMAALGEKFELPEDSSFLFNASATIAKTMGRAGIASLASRTAYLDNLIFACMGAAQDLAGQQGRIATEKLRERRDRKNTFNMQAQMSEQNRSSPRYTSKSGVQTKGKESTERNLTPERQQAVKEKILMQEIKKLLPGEGVHANTKILEAVVKEYANKYSLKELEEMGKNLYNSNAIFRMYATNRANQAKNGGKATLQPVVLQFAAIPAYALGLMALSWIGCARYKNSLGASYTSYREPTYDDIVSDFGYSTVSPMPDNVGTLWMYKKGGKQGACDSNKTKQAESPSDSIKGVPGSDLPGKGIDWVRLKGDQGWKKLQDGSIWKKDQLHKDHWDVSNGKGDKIKEVDFQGNRIWPNGPKNKNKMPPTR